jgi:hypothetical protein
MNSFIIVVISLLAFSCHGNALRGMEAEGKRKTQREREKKHDLGRKRS